MKILFDIALVVAVILGVLVIAGQCSAEDYSKKTKITDTNRRVVGYIYDPGSGRRTQILNNRGQIKYYVERDGRITDTRRRRVYELELPDTSDLETETD